MTSNIKSKKKKNREHNTTTTIYNKNIYVVNRNATQYAFVIYNHCFALSLLLFLLLLIGNNFVKIVIIQP